MPVKGAPLTGIGLAARMPKIAALPKIAPKTGKDKRQVPRMTLDELNEGGEEVLRERFDQVRTKKDDRPAYVKFLDLIDLPRNVVAQVIGELAGVDKSKLPKGALGLPKVFMSDVLDKLGVKNRVAKAVLGFAGDTAIDILTYIGLASRGVKAIAAGAPRVVKGGIRAAERVAAVGKAGVEAVGTYQKAAQAAAGVAARQAAKSAMRERIARTGLKVPQEMIAALGIGPKHAAKAPEIMARLSHYAARKPSANTVEAMTQILVKRGMKTTAATNLAKTIISAQARKLPVKGTIFQRLGAQLERPRSYEGLKAAAAWFRKYGEKGRSVARLPFMERAATLPFGSKARAYKELGSEGSLRKVWELMLAERKAAKGVGPLRTEAMAKTAEALGAATGLQAARRKLVQAVLSKDAAGIAEAKKAVAALEPVHEAAGLAAAGPRRALKAKLREIALARGRDISARYAPEAPTWLRQAQEARTGKQALEVSQIPRPPAEAPLKEKIAYWGERLRHAGRRTKQKIFGPGASEFHQKLVGITEQTGRERMVAEQTVTREFEKMARPVVEDLSKQLWKSGKRYTPDELYDMMISLREAGANAPDAYHALDPARKLYQEALSIGLNNEPGVQKILGSYRQTAGTMSKVTTLHGVAPEFEKGFYKRVPVKEFSKAAAGEEARLGAEPFAAKRAKLMEFTEQASGAKRLMLSSDLARIKELGGGWAKTGEWKVSTAFYNAIAEAKGNVDEAVQGIGKALRGPFYKGAQFERRMAVSAGAVASEQATRLGLANLRDISRATGVRLTRADIAGKAEYAHLGIPSLDRASPFYSVIGKQLEGHAFPKPVSDMLTEFFRATGSDKDIGRLGAGLDWFFRQWKSFALLHPAYTSRNVFQNLFGGMMAGANPLRMAQWATNPKIKAIQKAVEKGDPLPNISIKLGEIEYPVEAIIETGKMYNMFQSAASSQIWSSGSLVQGAREATEQTLKTGFDPLRTGFFRLNTTIETRMRLGLWFTLMEEGISPRAAAMKTLLGMPDLTDISLFERKWFAKIWPWYRWMRRNGALQMFHYLPNKPQYLAGMGKARNAIEQAMVGDGVPEELRPEWMREQQGTQVTGDNAEGQVWLMSSWMPFEELIKAGSGFYDVGAFSKMVVEQGRPEVKWLAETAVGQDIFKKRPVKPFGMIDFFADIPQATAGLSNTPMDNLFAIRPVREVRRVWEQPGIGGKARRVFLGGAVQNVSRERGLMDRASILRDRAAELRRQLNRAREAKDAAAVKGLMEQLFQTWAEMAKMGLPGVPKATQQLLKKRGLPVVPQAY